MSPFFIIVLLFLGILEIASAQGITYSNDIHISEFLPHPAGGGTTGEFIELHNTSGAVQDISGWILDDIETGGSNPFIIPSETMLPDDGYIAFYTTSPHVSLNDAGDHVRLIRPDGVVQDDVVYTASKEGYSYNRTDTGTYEEHVTPTPNEKNSSNPTPEPSPSISPSPSPSPPVYSSLVYVNEFLPNPEGDDAVGEFIELINTGSEIIDISEWIIDDITDTGSSPFSIPEETSISGNGFVTFYRRQTKLSMNNDSDHVRLVRPDGVIQSDVSYISTKEKHSYNRTDTGIYEQSSTISPNATNIFTAVSSPAPKPSDDDEEDKKESVAYDFSEKIIINELLPNPIGEDAEAEFIEIKSQDTKTINLFGWTLDDEEGGSKPYHFTEKDILIPGKILVLFRSKTKLALNNDTDSVRLLDPNRKIISSIQYKQKFSEGQSYSSTPEKTFVWSDTPTPGKENTIYIQEKISPTPKQKAVKKAATPKKTSIPVQQNPPRVLAAITSPSMLPWPEASHKEGVVTRSVIDTRPFRAKQGIFVAFGVTVAGMQLVSGISHKERIWQK